MVDAVAGEADGKERATVSSRTETAIANSSPDFNHMMMRLIRGLFNVKGKPWWVAVPSIILGSVLASLMLFFVVGLSSMVGGVILVDKVSAGVEQRRSFELEMFKLQTDVEIKKLDRTMLGDGAMKTLSAISSKLDEQGAAITRLNDSVNGLSKRQGALASQQQQLRDRIEKR